MKVTAYRANKSINFQYIYLTPRPRKSCGNCKPYFTIILQTFSFTKIPRELQKQVSYSTDCKSDLVLNKIAELYHTLLWNPLRQNN